MFNFSQMKVASSVWNLGSGGGRSYRNHRGRLVPEVSLRQLRLIENLGSCVHGQVIPLTGNNPISLIPLLCVHTTLFGALHSTGIL